MVSQRTSLIEYLVYNGWHRDNRCRIHETYKKTIGYRVFRVQLRDTTFFLDRWLRPEDINRVRGRWEIIQSRYFNQMNSVRDFAFLEIDDDFLQVDDYDHHDHHDYLDRLGVL